MQPLSAELTASFKQRLDLARVPQTLHPRSVQTARASSLACPIAPNRAKSHRFLRAFDPGPVNRRSIRSRRAIYFNVIVVSWRSACGKGKKPCLLEQLMLLSFL